MAVNFEATFVQPLLARLDAGSIGDAKQWANAITDLYIASVKLGLPGAVPATLPAPGLNPGGPPPPFPIGVIGFINAESRKRQMYNIIYAYFVAKQLSIQKGSIDNMTEIVQSSIRKIKRTQKQIGSLNQQAKQLTKELAQLPTLIKEIYVEIKTILRGQIDDIESLIESIREGEFGGISKEEFRQIFATELRMIDTLKGFDVSDPASISAITRLVQSQADKLKSRLQSPNREELIRRDLTNKLVKIANDAVRFLQIPVSPSSFVDFANTVKSNARRFKRLADRILRIDFVIRFIKPKLDKIKAKILERLRYMRDKLQAKLKALAEERKKRIQERAELKGESKAEGIFTKAKKALKDFAAWNKAWIKKYAGKLKIAASIIKRTVKIIAKVTALVGIVIQDFQQIKALIKRLKDKATNIGNRSVDFVQSLKQTNTEQERLKLASYFQGLGFPMLVEFASSIVNETLCTAKDVIYLFERKTAKYKKIAEEIEQIGPELKPIQQDIQDLFTTEEGRNRRAKRRALRRSNNPNGQSWVGRRITSLKDVFVRLFNWFKPKVEKTLNWIKSFYKKTKDYVVRITKKLTTQLEEYALALVPLNSQVEDVRTKQQTLDAKRLVVRDAKKKIKQLFKRLQAAQKVIPSSIRLITNLENGRIGLGENQQSINVLADGIYDYKSFEKEPTIKQQLFKEKEAFKSDFNTLVVIEVIVKMLGAIAKAVLKDRQIKREWQNLKQDLSNLATSLEPNQLQTVQLLTSLFEAPPKKPTLNQIKGLANLGSNALLQDKQVVQKLFQFEAKIKRKLLQSFSSILQNPAISRKIEEIENPPLGSTTSISTGKSSLFYEAYKGLESVRNSVNKQESLVLSLLVLLGKLVSKFFAWVNQHVTRWIKSIKASIKRRIIKVKQEQSEEVKERGKKRINPQAAAMTIMFGLAARVFWTGARWVGPTQTQFTCLTIGSFRPRMKARIEDGATGFLREMAKGFQAQLIGMKGLAVPPANTGIPPLSFSTYT